MSKLPKMHNHCRRVRSDRATIRRKNALIQVQRRLSAARLAPKSDPRGQRVVALETELATLQHRIDNPYWHRRRAPKTAA